MAYCYISKLQGVFFIKEYLNENSFHITGIRTSHCTIKQIQKYVQLNIVCQIIAFLVNASEVKCKLKKIILVFSLVTVFSMKQILWSVFLYSNRKNVFDWMIADWIYTFVTSLNDIFILWSKFYRHAYFKTASKIHLFGAFVTRLRTVSRLPLSQKFLGIQTF